MMISDEGRPMRVHVRPARAEEWARCVDIHRTAWRGMTFVPQNLHSPAENRVWMREHVFGRQYVMVAEIEGEVVGFLSMAEGMVHNLYVLPDFHNQGVGSALLDVAKTSSDGSLRLWVFEPNKGAIRFYERHGFGLVKRTDGSQNEENVPDRLMAWPVEPPPTG
jgi:ribosomal protein S18 acetylase RimI-like enzyme